MVVRSFVPICSATLPSVPGSFSALSLVVSLSPEILLRVSGIDVETSCRGAAAVAHFARDDSSCAEYHRAGRLNPLCRRGAEGGGCIRGGRYVATSTQRAHPVRHGPHFYLGPACSIQLFPSAYLFARSPFSGDLRDAPESGPPPTTRLPVTYAREINRQQGPSAMDSRWLFPPPFTQTRRDRRD